MGKIMHTPGPWDRSIPPAEKHPFIWSKQNKYVAQIIALGMSCEEAEANADLIVAAPDLLAALEEIADDDCHGGCVPCRQQCHNVDQLLDEIACLREIARSAISKATGEDA